MSHSYTNLLIHVVFSTHKRHPWISAGIRPRLHAYMATIARNEIGDVIVVGGTADHVHGLIVLPADMSVAHAMSRWKSLSSGWIHRTFAALADFAWQEGYSAFSVSRSNADAVKAYIETQEEHHRHRSFKEELVALLQRLGIEFDPERVFD
jgi:REP element-mobilizing transposase RayT